MNIIFPTPREVKDSGRLVKIGTLSMAGFTLETCRGEVADSAKAYIEESFNSKCAILPPYCGEFAIKLSVGADARLAGKGDEAYLVNISDNGAELVAASDRSTYYAAVTLCELIEIKGNGVYLPACEIVDYPKFEKRGVLVESRYNDFMTLDDWKSAIDDFAKLKLNKMEVATYGCWSKQYDGKLSEQQYIPFESIPEFNNPKKRVYYSVKKGGFVNIPETQPEMYAKDFFGDVVAYGKTKNVEVFPLFNSLGHNTLLPRIKPEISAKDENGDPTHTGFCTSNEETYKTLFALYDEMIDRYLAPNGITSFSVGLDEVSDKAFCKCPACRGKEKTEIFTNHAIRLIKHLKSRGMKEVYIYDDMYLYIFGNLDEALAKKFKDADVYDVTVMDWWNYGARVDFFRGLEDKMNKSFEKSIIRPMSGYWHWQCWSDHTLNISYCASKGEELDFDGMISYSTYEPCLDYNYAFLSEACWAPIRDKEQDILDFSKKYFEKHYSDSAGDADAAWQFIRHRIHPYNYDEKPPSMSEFAQYIYSYIKADLPHPRNHIAECIAKIDADPYKYVTFLQDITGRSKTALEFFAGEKATASAVNEQMLATINELWAYAEEFLTLYRIYKESREGKLSNAKIRAMVEHLIRVRKAHMLLVENGRLESTRHQTLRMMTISLEYYWEMLEKIDAADAAGEQYIYDPEAAIDREAPIYKYLR